MSKDRETFNAFSGSSLSSALGESLRIARSDIQRESPERLLSVHEEDYVAEILQRLEAQPFTIDFENFEVQSEMRQVRGSEFPSNWNVEPTRYYPRPVYVIYLPYHGSPDVLKHTPSVLHMWQPKLFVAGQSIGFEILSFGEDDEIARIKDQYFMLLEQQLVNVNRDINAYNAQLREIVSDTVREQRLLLEKQEDVASRLGGKRRLTHVVTPDSTEDLQPHQEPDLNQVGVPPVVDTNEAIIGTNLIEDDAIRVFISYSHDSAEHSDRVWELCARLVEDGIECHIDEEVEGMPERGWQRWMEDQIEAARYVLVICTETYLRRMRGMEEPGKGKGANWEGLIITNEIYRREGKNLKFIPVVFSEDDINQIPNILTGATYYNIAREGDYEKLYRHLTRQPRRRLPIRGKIRHLSTEGDEGSRTRPNNRNKLDQRFAARFEGTIGPIMGTLRMFLRATGSERPMDVFATRPADLPNTDYPDPALLDELMDVFARSNLKGPSNISIGDQTLSWGDAFTRLLLDVFQECRELLKLFPGRDEALTLVVEDLSSRAETLAGMISTMLHTPHLASHYNGGIPDQHLTFFRYFFLTILRSLRIAGEIKQG
jgi:hypothetical protein